MSSAPLRRLVGSALAVVWAGTGHAQVVPAGQRPDPTQPERGTAIVMGQVVDARGAGVADALVALQGGIELAGITPIPRPIPGGARRTLTNRDGRFVFLNLPSGSYSLTAAKTGYQQGAYGRRRADGPVQSFEVADGERQLGLTIPMWQYAAVSGTVVDETGEPMVGVYVQAFRRTLDAGRQKFDTAPASVTADSTDDRGEFRIDAMPPGEYVLGILTTQATVPRAMIDALAESQQSAAATLRPFTRAGMTSASVGTRGVRYIGDWAWFPGDRTLLAVPNPAGDGRESVYPTTFYPAAPSIESAEVLTLQSGDDRAGLNLSLSLVPASSVSGRIVGPGGPAAGVPIRLMPEHAASVTSDRGVETAITISDATGSFAFVGVPAGRYVLRVAANGTTIASAAPPPDVAGGLWVEQPLTVGDSAVTDVVLGARPGFAVRGRVVYDGSLPKPTPQMMARFSVRLDPADHGASRISPLLTTTVDASGAFTFTGVPPGRYYIIFLASAADRRVLAGWETKGATLDGRDVSTRPMEVRADVEGAVLTITDRPSEITGSVRNAQGTPDPTAAVLLFTADREYWVDFGSSSRRMRTVRVSEAGLFTLRGVPAGNYFLAAVPDEIAVDWQTSRVMDQLSRVAVRLSIQDGERRTQDLTVRTIR
jgi:protocatechuate 3,4-dioxygenase beta subunit